MIIASVSWTTIGFILFFVSLGITLRANPTSRIPAFAQPAHIPPGSILLRSFGGGLIGLGTVTLSQTIGYWALTVLAPYGVAIAAIFVHNRRILRPALATARRAPERVLYREVTRGPRWMRAAGIAILVFLCAMVGIGASEFENSTTPNPMVLAPLLALAVLSILGAALLLILSQIEVTITPARLVVHLTPLRIMSIPLTTIHAVEIITVTPWMAGGFGWRFAGDTHYALLSPGPAIEITLTTGATRVIRTDHPHASLAPLPPLVSTGMKMIKLPKAQKVLVAALPLSSVPILMSFSLPDRFATACWIVALALFLTALSAAATAATKPSPPDLRSASDPPQRSATALMSGSCKPPSANLRGEDDMVAQTGWHESDDGAWWYWDGQAWNTRLAPPPPPHRHKIVRTLQVNLRDPWTRWATVALLCSATVTVACILATVLMIIPAILYHVGPPAWLAPAISITAGISAALAVLVHSRGATSPTPPEEL